ncbi:MAG: tRNA lysidine(34) synthetase TilS [Lachnospiraceae bacterium]|nr:tRNA lysidine(34) synthetase TilS [Lachnospiraceae bacterium]
MKITDDLIKKMKMNDTIKDGDICIVGVSGGPDSIYLLYVLNEACKDMYVKLHAVHVNHNIRGEEADSDERFVEEYCKELDIPIHIYSVNVPEFARNNKISEEEAGRSYRYKMYAKLAYELAAEDSVVKLFLGHHMDDQAETVLFHLFRGSSLKGIGGMNPERDFFAEDFLKPEFPGMDIPVSEFKIERPLLGIRKQEIIDELNGLGISWKLDETNMDVQYTRNKIRNIIIPSLEENIQKESVRHIADTAGDVREVQDFLDSYASTVYAKIVKKEKGITYIFGEEFKALHIAVQKHVAMRIISNAAGKRKDITREHIMMFIRLCNGETGKKISLPYRVVAEKSYEKIYVYKKKKFEKKPIDVDNSLIENISDMEEIIYINGKLVTERSEIYGIDFKIRDLDTVGGFDRGDIKKTYCTKYFDCDKINGALSLRYPKEGDYIILGGGQEKKFSRFMIDQKIPRMKRKSLLVLACGNHVLWVPDYDKVSTGAYLDNNTKKVLVAEIGTIA